MTIYSQMDYDLPENIQQEEFEPQDFEEHPEIDFRPVKKLQFQADDLSLESEDLSENDFVPQI